MAFVSGVRISYSLPRFVKLDSRGPVPPCCCGPSRPAGFALAGDSRTFNAGLFRCSTPTLPPTVWRRSGGREDGGSGNDLGGRLSLIARLMKSGARLRVLIHPARQLRHARRSTSTAREPALRAIRGATAIPGRPRCVWLGGPRAGLVLQRVRAASARERLGRDGPRHRRARLPHREARASRPGR